LAVALLFALAPLSAGAAGAQGEAKGELFTTVELKGLDLSAYDDKILEAVLREMEPRSGRSARRAVAAALAARGNFFRDQGIPSFYKYALGDFRHAVRFWPGDKDSKRKADEIVRIYESLGRPVPQNGNTEARGFYPVELYRTTPERIPLEPGKSYAYAGSVSARAAYVYEFVALAGQKLSVAVAPKEGKGEVVFDIYEIEARGRKRAFVMGLRRADYALPLRGKYLIRVYSESGGSDYVLTASMK